MEELKSSNFETVSKITALYGNPFIFWLKPHKDILLRNYISNHKTSKYTAAAFYLKYYYK